MRGEGLLLQFRSAEDLVAAARALREAGVSGMEAYTPYPVPELDPVLGHGRGPLPWIVLMAGIAGGLLGYGLQVYASVVDYPLNVGGRPLHSWPSFVPVTFELTVLFAAAAAVVGMLALNRLPEPHHRLFAVAAFRRASIDRFFLHVEDEAAGVDRERLLRAAGPRVEETHDVPA